MPHQQLVVCYRDRTVGRLSSTDRRWMLFEYDAGWIAAEDSFPVSTSLPLDGEGWRDDAAHHFFANLLPEAGVRQRICQSLKISPQNDFELLRAIGGDCAGALTIVPESGSRSRDERYEAISERQLSEWSVGAPDAFSAITGQREIRLSLAGAQDKLPVKWDGRQFLIPVGGAPSTHLLKFASPHWSHLPENETLTTWIAAAAGLPVVAIRLHASLRARFAVVERYDRVARDDGFDRLHQEDFCQALGIGPANKYEKEGGPSLADCCRVLRERASVPAIEIRKLLQWALFNWLAGNADGHGKNLSLLLQPGGSVGLAPFYDLVCTRNYRRLDRHLAMGIGGVSDPGQIGARELDGLARELEISGQLVRRELQQLGERMRQAIPEVCRDFQAQFGESPVLQRLPRIMQINIRRANRNSSAN